MEFRLSLFVRFADQFAQHFDAVGRDMGLRVGLVGHVENVHKAFLSTLSLRRATKIRLHPYGPGIISIHALLAESDRSLSCVYLSCRISIHALLAESDPTQPSRPCWTTHFYPRSPCGERRWAFVWTTGKTRFLSTLSLRRATRTGLTCGDGRNISIHALLAESDHDGRVNLLGFQNFYPRSPCGERQFQMLRQVHHMQFLSTLSLRRATVMLAGILAHHAHFYPRSPCGERLMNRPQHSLSMRFLSTLSLRRATAHSRQVTSSACHFYPRSPCGERRPDRVNYAREPAFLSTLSLRRATQFLLFAQAPSAYFYPRSPCGERQRLGLPGWLRVLISIHALLAESDPA